MSATTEIAPAPAPNGTLAQEQPGTLTAPPPDQGRPQIAMALAAARKRVRPVQKDATNPHHKYAYAAADSIIEEALYALDDSGLSLVPVEQSIDGHDREGPDRFELVKKLLLIHRSGEWLPVTLRWPVCPQAGRPLDKAAAAADTLSLSYYLRDLLLMPRVSAEDDVAARDDRRAPAPQAPPPPPEAELHRKALRTVHRRLSARGKLWSAALAHVGVTLPEGWTDPPAGDDGLAVSERLAPWVSRAVCDRILALLAPKGKPAPQPAQTSPAAGAMATPEQCRAIWHQARSSNWKTAVALLTSLGVVMPDDADEPLSDAAADSWARWLSAQDASRALQKLAAAAKPAPKG